MLRHAATLFRFRRFSMLTTNVNARQRRLRFSSPLPLIIFTLSLVAATAFDVNIAAIFAFAVDFSSPLPPHADADAIVTAAAYNNARNNNATLTLADHCHWSCRCFDMLMM